MAEPTLTPMIIAKVIKATVLGKPNLKEKERTVDILFFTGNSVRYSRIFTLKCLRTEKDEYSTDTHGMFVLRETVFIRKQKGNAVSFGFAQSKLPVNPKNLATYEKEKLEYFSSEIPHILILPKNFLDLLEPEKD